MKRLLVLSSFLLFSFNVLAKPVNINTADAQTIADSLKGIGLKKAQAIVDYRAKNGNFAAVDDLSKVSGIKAKTISQNKDDILLSDDTPAVDTSKTDKSASEKSSDKTQKASKDTSK